MEIHGPLASDNLGNTVMVFAFIAKRFFIYCQATSTRKSKPSKIAGMVGKKVISVSCGEHHVMALTGLINKKNAKRA